MPWHLVTRGLFIAAVAWAAALTRAFHPALAVNLGVGVGLGGLIVLIETRLRSTEVTDLLGALTSDRSYFGQPACGIRGVILSAFR